MAFDNNTTLETVEDYATDMRTLLLDTVSPYRYGDASLLVALNVTLLEMRRLRPDLFIYRSGRRVPHYTALDDTPVPIEEPFRLALLYGACGHALVRDQEDVQDTRANSFMNLFATVLLGKRPANVNGGSPGSSQKPANPSVPPPGV